VHDWVKIYAKENYVKPEPKGEAVIVELDEMWHYLHTKKLKSVCGKLFVTIPISLSTGNAGDEIMLHFQGFMSD
jgi:hypothetical protein